MPSLFANLPIDANQEIMETLANSPNVRIERIVSYGHCSPAGFWYDQNDSEWVIVLRGAATLRLQDADGNDELVEMKPGDWINIAAHRRHRVEWTAPNEPTVWLAVHYS